MFKRFFLFLSPFIGNISAIKLYLPDIHELIEPLFTSSSWGLREKAAKATLTIADALGMCIGWNLLFFL